MILSLILKGIKHRSVITPFSLYVPSTFLTLIGDFNMLVLHLCAIDLSINRPSAPESIKAVISSVFSTVSTLIGMENRRFEIDRTVIVHEINRDCPLELNPLVWECYPLSNIPLLKILFHIDKHINSLFLWEFLH
jgi:hypothetical protein